MINTEPTVVSVHAKSATITVYREALERQGFHVRDVDYEEFIGSGCVVPVSLACFIIDADNIDVGKLVQYIAITYPDVNIFVISEEFTDDEYGEIAGVSLFKIRKPISEEMLTELVNTTTKFKAVNNYFRLIHIHTTKVSSILQGMENEHDSNKASSR